MFNDELENRRGEVNFEVTFVDGDFAGTFFENYAGYGCFTAANCINLFHCALRLFEVVDVDLFGILCSMGMLGAVVDV